MYLNDDRVSGYRYYWGVQVELSLIFWFSDTMPCVPCVTLCWLSLIFYVDIVLCVAYISIPEQNLIIKMLSNWALIQSYYIILNTQDTMLIRVPTDIYMCFYFQACKQAANRKKIEYAIMKITTSNPLLLFSDCILCSKLDIQVLSFLCYPWLRCSLLPFLFFFSFSWESTVCT